MMENLPNTKIPQGWTACNLPDFAHIEMGQSPPSDTYNFEGIGMPFFQGKAEFTELYPEIKKYCSKPNKIAKAGSVLLTVRAPVGPTNLANIDCCIGRGLAGIYPLDAIESKFILLLIRSIEIRISGQGTGSTFTAINKTFLEKLSFAIPPTNEQKRIVGKIEELFVSLDKGVESLKLAQNQLKTYRQSILKHAFEGKLTAKWREENAVENSWKDIPLKRVIEEPKYGTSKKCGYDTKGTGVLRIPNIVSGFVNSSDLKYAQFDKAEIEKYSLQVGDILTIRSNGSVSIVGKSALIREQDKEFLYAGYLIRLRPNKSEISPEFLHQVLSSHALRVQIENKAKSTSGVNNINAGELKSLTIPICSLQEQQQIVSEIEAKFSGIDQLEKDIEENLKRSETLRQSILKKAFSGQLVAQDPNDEPASELIKRIKAEKALQAPTKRKKRKSA